MSRKLTLAEQLAQISEPAPQDVDPEDAYSHGVSIENDNDNEAVEAARAEYAEVGKSALRKRADDFDLGEKYRGAKGSRVAFEGLSDGSDDDDDNDEEDDAGGDDRPDPEDESESDEDEEQERGLRQDDREMLSQLRTAASADVQKGIDVKKQISFTDSILESRIKLQKALTAANTLPVGPVAKETFDQLPEELAETIEEVEALQEQLFTFRHKLMQSESMTTPALPRKRPFSSTDMSALEQALDPFLRSTITKWSDKVAAASGLSSSKAKFKAINTNVLVNIDQMLSNSAERERLVKRTRTRRAGQPARLGRSDAPLEGDKKDVDVECFDDGDFYAQLLRDIVESRSADLVDDPTLAALRDASARSKKNKRVVDTRASKGRKIRYDVHEKIQNFMIPIQAGSWHDEQIDELFSSLLGRSARSHAQSDMQPEQQRPKRDGLKIFG